MNSLKPGETTHPVPPGSDTFTQITIPTQGVLLLPSWTSSHRPPVTAGKTDSKRGG